LANELPKLKETLAQLRKKTLGYTEARGMKDRESDPEAILLRQKIAERQKIKQSLTEVPAKQTWTRRLSRIFKLDKEISELSKRVAARHEYVFESAAEEFLHATLSTLIEDLEKFTDPKTGPPACVKERLVWAKLIHQKTTVEPRAKWEEAIAAIAASDGELASQLYKGYRLESQLGLVPIGIDPVSKLWEFAHLRSGSVAERHPGSGKLIVGEGTGLVFVLIPGGSFTMGAQKNAPNQPNFDRQAEANESPLRELSLGPFFLSKYEMTQAQWRRLSGGDTPSVYGPGIRIDNSPNIMWTNPVEMVTWGDCDRVLRQQGLVLPTEAQWEYACRAGTATPWWTGTERQSLVGAVNLADRSAVIAKSPWPATKDWPEFEDGFVVHAPVDTLRPNPFGLHHMYGNVSEWCRDWYGGYEAAAAPGDGLLQVAGTDAYQVRGGSFVDAVAQTRSAGRYCSSGTSQTVGCRPARVVTP
jgi:formylglycine-generating enzyme required for sulfatase activity